jgi:hypothetical protein
MYIPVKAHPGDLDLVIDELNKATINGIAIK